MGGNYLDYQERPSDIQFHPGYFGKLGMRHYHLLRNQYYRPTINIDKVSLDSRSTVRIRSYDRRGSSHGGRGRHSWSTPWIDCYGRPSVHVSACTGLAGSDDVKPEGE
jgi:hypothetical protein